MFTSKCKQTVNWFRFVFTFRCKQILNSLDYCLLLDVKPTVNWCMFVFTFRCKQTVNWFFGLNFKKI